MFSLVAESFNSIATVKSLSNLLVCVDEALKLRVQLNILAGQNVAVVLQGINFCSAVSVGVGHRLSLEAQVVLLTPVGSQVIVSATILTLEIVQIRRKVTVASKFAL